MTGYEEPLGTLAALCWRQLNAWPMSASIGRALILRKQPAYPVAFEKSDEDDRRRAPEDDPEEGANDAGDEMKARRKKRNAAILSLV